MFFLIRKVILAAGIAALGVLGYWAYQQRATFRPALDVASLWFDTRGAHGDIVGEASGEVIQVWDGITFQLREDGGAVRSVRLAGLDGSAWTGNDAAARRLFSQSRSNLKEFILDRRVRVQWAATNELGNGLAIALVNGTNVNQQLVENGIAPISTRGLGTLPLSQQYRLLSAQQRAQEKRVGIWK